MSITGHDGGGVGMTTVGGDGVASGGSGDGAAVVGAGVAGAAVGTTVTGAVVGCADGGSATVQSTEQHVAPPTTCMHVDAISKYRVPGLPRLGREEQDQEAANSNVQGSTAISKPHACMLGTPCNLKARRECRLLPWGAPSVMVFWWLFGGCILVAATAPCRLTTEYPPSALVFGGLLPGPAERTGICEDCRRSDVVFCDPDCHDSMY